MWLLDIYFKTNLLLRILIALFLGAIGGIIFEDPNVSTTGIAIFTPLGDIFIRLLKMLGMPIIVCSLIVGTSNITPARLGKVGIKMMAFYSLTSICAISIGLSIGTLLSLNPNANETIFLAKNVNDINAAQTLLNIIPTNPFSSISQGEILPSIFFCICFGLGLAFSRDSKDERIKNSAENVYKFFEGASEIIFKMVGWVMQYAPIGVFSLIFVVFRENGKDAFGPLANITCAVYLGLIAQIVFVYCLLCMAIRLSPIKFIQRIRLPMITALITRSSTATIPVSMDTAQKDMGVPRRICSFTIPVGATINMDGTTIYLGVCVMFIANAIGINLDFSKQVAIVITTILASIGTAGIPGAGAIMLIMVLQSIGIHVEAGTSVAIAYGMILGIDALLDMGRTSMNVVGDLASTLIVAKSENELDMTKWQKSPI